MAKVFSISELSYTTDKDGNPIDLERLLAISAYRVEVTVHEDEADTDKPFKVDATYYNAKNDVAASLELERFFTESGTPYLDIDKLDVTETGEGVGTRIFEKVLGLAEALDIKLLSVSPCKVGSYSWAALGFYPSVGKWPDMHKEIKNRAIAMDLPEVNISTRFDLPKFAQENPKELLLDLSWFGTMNLTDEEQMAHCRNYMDTKLGRGI